MKFPLITVTHSLPACLNHFHGLPANNVAAAGILHEMKMEFARAFEGYPPLDIGINIANYAFADQITQPNQREYFGLSMIAEELKRIREDPNAALHGGSLKKHMRRHMKTDTRMTAAKAFLKDRLFANKSFKKLDYGDAASLRARIPVPFNAIHAQFDPRHAATGNGVIYGGANDL